MYKMLSTQEIRQLTQPINDLAILIHENNVKQGFWNEKRNIGEALMLVVSELGEAIEAHRKNQFTDISHAEKANMSNHFEQEKFQACIKNTFEDELADSIIRLLDLAAGLGVDIAWHLQQKIIYNTTRPFKHGKTY